MSRVRIPFPAQAFPEEASLHPAAWERGSDLVFELPRRPHRTRWRGFVVVRPAPYPSGKGEVCKTFMRRFESARRLSSVRSRQSASPRLRQYAGIFEASAGKLRPQGRGNSRAVEAVSRGGETGRRTGLKILFSARGVPVQFRSPAPSADFNGLLAQLVRALP